MINVRAVVLGGVIVVPALAVAGLTRYGVSIPSMFTRNAIVNSEVSITAPVAHEFRGRATRAQGEEAVDSIEAARIREAMARIVEGKGGVAQDTTPALVFTDSQEPTSVDHLRAALGVVLKDDSELRLTRNVNSVDAPAAEPSDEGLRLDDVNAGAFAQSTQLSDAIFPGVSVRDLTGEGVEQGAQAPAVQRVAISGGAFAGNESSGGRRAPSFLGFNEEDITSNGDTPAPGAFALGVIGLVALGRRRK